MTRELSVLKSQLKALTDKAKTIGWEVEDIKEGYYQVPPAGKRVTGKTLEGSGQPDPRQLLTENTSPPSAPEKKKVINIEDGLNSDPAYYFRTAPQRPDTPAPVAGAADLKTGAIDGGGLQIFTTESVRQQVVEASKDADTYLPAGSIISGVLLNGLDAPTGRNAKKDPFPVLVRIQKDAVLPNLFNVDVKECFATLSGYGEMSSERAYLRGEKLSCVTNEAEIIEQDFPAYGVGEDGKAGVRGRLVTKAGSLLAKTALSGFAAGVAEAFNTSPVPVIQTGTPGNDALFQQNYSSDAVQHGVSKGASASLARLAEYYMDMADQIFPVVEVDASRQIDIVLTSGLRLKVKKLDTRKIARR
jgi:conjugal transfer pilus assembly protein TraB